MTKQSNQPKSSRRRYSAEFKVEALGLAGHGGVASAVKQAGLYESQL
jgi:transposase